MYKRQHTYTYTHTHTHSGTHIHTGRYTHVYTLVHTGTHIYTQAYIHTENKDHAHNGLAQSWKGAKLIQAVTGKHETLTPREIRSTRPQVCDSIYRKSPEQGDPLRQTVGACQGRSGT